MKTKEQRAKHKSYYKRVNVLKDKEFWKGFFEKNPEYIDREQKELEKLVEQFFYTAGEALCNQPNGVVLDGLGYFALTVHKEKKVLPMAKVHHLNLLNGGKIYQAIFYPSIIKNFAFEFWQFQICRKWRNTLRDNIRAGMQFVNFYHLLKKQGNNGKKYFLRRVRK